MRWFIAIVKIFAIPLSLLPWRSMPFILVCVHVCRRHFTISPELHCIAISLIRKATVVHHEHHTRELSGHLSSSICTHTT